MCNSLADTGLSSKVIEQMQKVFAHYPNIEQAILYGSRAKGNFRLGSDIDLALKGETLTFRDLAAADLEIDDLLLPYKVDLSLLRDIDNPDLLDHIQRVGMVFYQRD